MKIGAILFLIVNFISLTFSPIKEDLGYTYPRDNLLSHSIIMVEQNSGKTIFSQNADEERAIASLTKIMTFIVAVENIPDVENTEIEFSALAYEVLIGSNASMGDMKIGETYTVLEYLYLLMLPSGADAAMQLAMYYDESQGYVSEFAGYASDGVDIRSYDMGDSPFIAKMNEKAQQLGCTSTNFTNSSGLHHEENYSTAYETMIITKYATLLPYFNDIVASEYYKLPPTNLTAEPRTIYNSNSLLSQNTYEGRYFHEHATGTKTGYLRESGFCLAASADNGEFSYIIIILGAPGDYSYNGAFQDAVNLLNWVYEDFNKAVIVEKGSVYTSLSVANSQDEIIDVAAQYDGFVSIPDEVEISDIKVSADLKSNIVAPIEKGQVLGELKLSLNGTVLNKIPLIATVDVIEFIPPEVEVLPEQDYQFMLIIMITIVVILALLSIRRVSKSGVYNYGKNRRKKRYNK